MDPAIWTVIGTGGPAVIVIAVLLIIGLPKLMEARDKESARDQQIQRAATDLAKEGLLMVLEEVKRQLVETKAELNLTREQAAKDKAELIKELKELHKQHLDCETKHSALQMEVQLLHNEVSRIQRFTCGVKNCNERELITLQSKGKEDG